MAPTPRRVVIRTIFSSSGQRSQSRRGSSAKSQNEKREKRFAIEILARADPALMQASRQQERISFESVDLPPGR
jgi:hypothetical protein